MLNRLNALIQEPNCVACVVPHQQQVEVGPVGLSAGGLAGRATNSACKKVERSVKEMKDVHHQASLFMESFGLAVI